MTSLRICLLESRSKWDNIAADIVRKIVDWLKNHQTSVHQFSSDPVWGEVKMKRNNRHTFAISGGTAGFDPYITVEIAIPGHWKHEDIVRHLSDIRSKLRDVVRHEVEHARDNLMPAAGRVELDGDESLEAYLFNPDELSAWSVGMYRRAQDARRPVSEIIDETIEEIREWFDDITPEDEKMLVRLKQAWVAEIKRRFPNSHRFLSVT